MIKEYNYICRYYSNNKLNTSKTYNFHFIGTLAKPMILYNEFTRSGEAGEEEITIIPYILLNLIMEIGFCKLCLRERKLLTSSHIISASFQKYLHDSMRRMSYVDMNTGKMRLLQKAFYESNILCAECDGILISKLENYVKALLTDTGFRSSKSVTITKRYYDIVPFEIIHGFDYTRFKLFVLSLMFRFHISKNIFFKDVNLGKHYEMFRQMLLNNDAGSENVYRVSIFILWNKLGKRRAVLTEPVTININYEYISIVISGIVFNVELSYSQENAVFKDFIKPNGTLEVPIMVKELAEDYLSAIYKGSLSFDD